MSMVDVFVQRIEPARSAAIIAPIALFAGHVPFGAGAPAAGLALSALWLFSAAICLSLPAGAHIAPRGSGAAACGLYLAALAVAIIPLTWNGAIERAAVATEALKLAGLAGGFTVGLTIGRSDRAARRFLHVFIGIGALYAAWALAEHQAAPDLVLGDAQTVHGGRLSGSFLSANTAGCLFAAILALAMAMVLRASRGAGEDEQPDGRAALAARLAAPMIIGLFLVTALLLTSSRSAVLAGTAAVLLLAIWRGRGAGRRRLRVGGAVAAALIALLGVFVVSGGAATARFEQLSQDMNDRLVLFDAHWGAFLEAPVTGHGLGGFARLNQAVQTPHNWGELDWVRAAHNVYLQWLEEAGLIAALAMFAANAAALWAVIQGARRRRHMRWALRGIAAFAGVYYGLGAVDYALQTPSMALQLAVVLGVGVGLAQERRGETRSMAPGPGSGSPSAPVPAR